MSRRSNEGRLAQLILVITLCGVQFVDVLCTTIVIVALPGIQSDLGLSDGLRDQVVATYALLFGALLLLAGRMADAWGARRLFLAGLLVFGAGSLVGGLATDGLTLLAGRAVQGVGAALAVPAALAILTDRFPPGPTRNRVLGAWAATGALGGAAGFLLGGPIAEGLGWRWTLLLNVPVVAVAAVAILPLRAGRPGQPGVSLPLGSSALLTGGLLGLTLGLSLLEGDAVPWPASAGAIAAGGGALWAFARGERGRRPLVPRATWADRRLTAGSAVAFALTFTTTAAAVPMTLYLQDTRGLSASASGWVFAAFNAGVVLGSWRAAGLVTARGAVPPMAAGLSGVAAGMLVWVVALGTGWMPLVVAGMLLTGASLGLTSVASTALAMEDAAGGEQGAASGLVNAAARVGSAAGIAAFGAVGALAAAAAPAGVRDTTVFGAQAAYVFGALFTVATIAALGWALRAGSRRPTVPPAGSAATGSPRTAARRVRGG